MTHFVRGLGYRRLSDRKLGRSIAAIEHARFFYFLHSDASVELGRRELAASVSADLARIAQMEKTWT